MPTDWEVDVLNDSEVRVTVPDRLDVMLPDNRSSRVGSAGQLPSGFNPGDRYQSRNHPQGPSAHRIRRVRCGPLHRTRPRWSF